MRYGIFEIRLSVVGSGALAGSAAVFVRFSGCNLWDGNPLRREEGAAACALWCDTDFRKGEVLDAGSLLARMDKLWLERPAAGRLCVLTGGEPALQLDDALLAALRGDGWSVAVETNGTLAPPVLWGVDHLCVSPKLGAPLAAFARAPDEVRVVLPGAPPLMPGWSDEALRELEAWADALPGRRAALYVQPQDPVLPGPGSPSFLKGGYDDEERELLAQLYHDAVERCLRWCRASPRWRVSAQAHKLLGLP